MRFKGVTYKAVEITFDEIRQKHLKGRTDYRIIKWLDEEGVEYFSSPNRCFLYEFSTAFEQWQARNVRLQNPIDFEIRIQRLREFEAKTIATTHTIAPALPPKTNKVLNPAFAKPEKLVHLTLSKKERVPGLQIYCYHKDCKCKKKPGKCKHPAEKEGYKLIYKTKEVSAVYLHEFRGIRDEKQAKDLARKLREITKLNGGRPKSFFVPAQGEKRDLRFVTQLMDEHLEHLQKNKGNDPLFLKEMRKKYDWMLKVFTDNKYEASKIMVNELNKPLSDGQTWVRKIDLEIDKREGKKKGKPIATTTKNNYITIFRSLFKFGIDERELDIKNPFKSLKIVNVRQEIKNRIKTIKEEEVKKLFEMLRKKTPLKKPVTYFSKKYKKIVTVIKSYFQPYLLDGILMGIAFGYRNANVADVKWSDIDLEEVYDKKSILNGIIKVWDLKVNAQKKLIREDAMKPIELRINEDICDILIKMGYEKYKGTDNYILAPNEKASRKTIISNVSRGFHEYMKLVLPDKSYQFKDLRKTQITREAKATSKEKASKRVHGDLSTTENNYFDDSVLLATAKENPTVFKGVKLSEL